VRKDQHKILRIIFVCNNYKPEELEHVNIEALMSPAVDVWKDDS